MTTSLFLQPEEIVLQLGVAVLAGPEVERGGGQFVDQRFGAAVFRQVYALDIGLAGVTAFHANVVEVAGGEDGKPFIVLLAASRADDAAKLPLGQAERTDQGARAAISHRPQTPRAGLRLQNGHSAYVVGLGRSEARERSNSA